MWDSASNFRPEWKADCEQSYRCLYIMQQLCERYRVQKLRYQHVLSSWMHQTFLTSGNAESWQLYVIDYLFTVYCKSGAVWLGRFHCTNGNLVVLTLFFWLYIYKTIMYDCVIVVHFTELSLFTDLCTFGFSVY